jgi:DNA-binding MarR family transcriptional regulator
MSLALAGKARPVRAALPPESGRHAGAILRTSIQRFVRSFGLLSSAQTPCGMPLPLSHAHALMALLERERRAESSTQQDLVKVLGVDKSNVTRLCAKMVEAGHVAQQPSPDDGRAWCVSLTSKGRRIAERVEDASRTRFDHLLAALPSNAVRATVIQSLDLLNDAIAKTRRMEEAE